MQRNKTQILFNRFMGVLVLLCFVGMTGYSELLHDHDLDFSASHDDCSPCNWTQSHKVNTTKKIDIANVFSFSETTFQLHFLKPEDFLPDFHNRAPPVQFTNSSILKKYANT
jgi:hypothetical protein|tara:strand:+ start:37 stop:372 length:336 start_codon:yes stop_codon:yes gene_type:complete